MPQQREVIAFRFNHGGLVEYRCTLGYLPSGKVGELQLDTDDLNVQDAANMASAALRSGVSIHLLQQSTVHDEQGRSLTMLGSAIDEIIKQQLDRAPR